MATLAHNLDVRRKAVLSCWPKTTIYWLGDAAHKSEKSDHNADARGIVHALDIMVAAGTAHAVATLKWALSHHADLEYIIHNRRIYEASNSWKGAAYSGSNPHTDHIHLSGKHGSTGRNAATGTGYDVVAEKSSPTGSPCEVATPVYQLGAYPGVPLRLTSFKSAAALRYQTKLNKNGYPLVLDGVFGANSVLATKKFQKAKGLTADGVVGPKTWAAAAALPK